MKQIILMILILHTCQLTAQPNCEAFKYYGDELKYKACKAAEKRAGHYQFSRKYQEALDEALSIDSTFAFAYRAKSTAYLKAGNFIEWKALMDKAVEYDPAGQLDYRGWCRFQFFRDYKGAIEDIELLDSIVDYDIGHSVNGDYHLQIARALCYKSLGKTQRAIDIILQQLQDKSHIVGLYDYLHLGVLNLELGKLDEAIQHFKIQEENNDLAENRFYISLAYKQMGFVEEYVENLKLAKIKYEAGFRMFDPYVEQLDKIYIDTIEKEIESAVLNGHVVRDE